MIEVQAAIGESSLTGWLAGSNAGCVTLSHLGPLQAYQVARPCGPANVTHAAYKCYVFIEPGCCAPAGAATAS